MTENFVCKTPEATFDLGETIGDGLTAGDVLLLKGGLGAGKTLLTKGILNALGFDIDEVTSPSFTLVNLYKTPTLNIYHIDLWRLDAGPGVAAAVGLDEILNEPNAVTIIEWAEKLHNFSHDSRVIEIKIVGDGNDQRDIEVDELDNRTSK
ncbi:MAG TPA: tRNA (adenosine(37)-N6)-threonylcarbamoyltransferase complex ATPase subunit type 1 TsaE [Pyrinomonadaceae bacterium]|nr:tRNA (adenosine(37)-N6)-threonylcarbamoyltransferase complex ATPase subunit type 1 TsaE [Pyrinomonadaceae bacterium]